MLLDHNGLTDGDRINGCSMMAQLYYPRIMGASNGFGRIRVDYRWLIAKLFPRWAESMVPPQEELLGYLQEYAHHRLLFLYTVAGQVWGQWDAKKGTFGKYQTADDKRSPLPPEKEWGEWIEANRSHSTSAASAEAIVHIELTPISEPSRKIPAKLRKPSQKVAAQVGHGVGVGLGVGEGVTCKVLREEPSPAAPEQPNGATVSRALAESKHRRIEHMIQECWSEHNAGQKCPWGPDDGAQLKRLLDKTTSWPDTNYSQCLTHIYTTEGFPRSELPVHFLPRLASYFMKPKDIYGKELGNGKHQGSNASGSKSAGKAAYHGSGSERFAGKKPDLIVP